MTNEPHVSRPDDRPPAVAGEAPVVAAADRRAEKRDPPAASDPRRDQRPPSLARQAWNLAESLADFVADGCHLVSADEYRRRLEICDGCDSRRDNRCMKCGCRLSLKARGRAFRCPLAKWPTAEDGSSTSTTPAGAKAAK